MKGDKTTHKFFSYLAKHFPVMCADDECVFMPPAAEALDRLHLLDDLSAPSMRKRLARIRGFRDEFRKRASDAAGPEKVRSRAMELCAEGVLGELDRGESWRSNPALYLRIVRASVRQALEKPARNDKERLRRTVKRLKAIPTLLETGAANIEMVDTLHLAQSQTLARDCARFLAEVGGNQLAGETKALALVHTCLESLKTYDRFVAGLPRHEESEGVPFASTVAEVYGSGRSAEEWYDIAMEQWRTAEKELLEAAREAGVADWREVSGSVSDDSAITSAPLDVLVKTIHQLRGHYLEKVFQGEFSDIPLRMDVPPSALASDRRAIIYEAALNGEHDSRCFINEPAFAGRRFLDNVSHLGRIRREYEFLTGFQTYPGRHFLEARRRELDMDAAQLTDPGFVAGWGVFMEERMVQDGWATTPLQRIILGRRAIYRAGLAAVDAGLAAGLMDQDVVLGLLGRTGLDKEDSLALVRDIRRAPGSRLLPVLGAHEIREFYDTRQPLSLVDFCRELFANGLVSPTALNG